MLMRESNAEKKEEKEEQKKIDKPDEDTNDAHRTHIAQDTKPTAKVISPRQRLGEPVVNVLATAIAVPVKLSAVAGPASQNPRGDIDEQHEQHRCMATLALVCS